MALACCLSWSKASAQLDTTFWFAAPEVAQTGDNYDRPIVLRISTLAQPSVITVSMPADPTFPPITVSVGANSTQTIDLTPWIDQIESKPPNTVLNSGLKVRATAMVNMYYEVVSGLGVSCQCNPEIFVFKGKNSLGTDFLIPSQTLLDNGSYVPDAYSAFDIVASQNNTTVTITPSRPIVGHPAGVPFTVVLNAGQVYSAAAVSLLAADHLAGSRVTSDKPVAITIKDDLLVNSGCRDLGGDQIIPIENLSDEYIAVQGFLTHQTGDRLFVTAVNNNTTVYVGGVAIATLNANQTIPIGFPTTALYVTASSKIYAFQLSGFGCEVGLTSIPSNSCRGSNNVSFTRSGTTALFMLVSTRAGNENYFQLNGTPLNPADFSPVPGTNNLWVYARISVPLSQIPALSSGRLTNSHGLFHLGIIHGDVSGGARFGYFSDFSRPPFDVLQDTVNVCGDSLVLDPGAGFVNYLWNIGDTTQTVGAHTNGLYQVTVTNTNGCVLRDSSFVNIQKPVRDSNDVTICAGQSYPLPWGQSVTTAGTYRDTTHFGTGCDSLIRQIRLHVNSATTSNTALTLCSGQSFTLPWGQTISSSGNYHDTLHYTAGCDSLIRNYSITIHAKDSALTSISLCAGQSYNLPWGGAPVSTSGLYSDTIRYASGCDSLIRRVQVTVNSTTVQNLTASICAGSAYQLPWGATANAAGIYSDTIRFASGCDSLIRTVTVAVNQPALVNLSAGICGNQSYTLPWGQVVTSPGIYRDTLHYVNGCDSLIRTVNLAVSTLSQTSQQANICGGQSYTLPWGASVTTAGVYRDTLHYSGGCDSLIREITLTVNPSTTTQLNAAICSGASYTLPWGASVTNAGIYRDTARYASGCDSLIRIVNLAVNAPLSTNTSATICGGQSYTLPWGSIVQNTGIYSDTIRYASGCDSLVRTVQLTVNNLTVTNSNISTCGSNSYTLPWGPTVTTSGVYSDTARYPNGCDSLIRIVNLSLNNPVTSVSNINLCAAQSFTLPWGQVVTSPGTFRDTLRFGAGCDSLIRVFNVSVNNPTIINTSANICGGTSYQLPWGVSVTAAGLYKDTLHHVNGCDSLIRSVQLSVNPAIIQNLSASICGGQSYTLPWGATANAAGVYRDTIRYAGGCDSLVRSVNLQLTQVNTLTSSATICSGHSYTLPWGAMATSTGIYRDTLRSVNGCDSLRRIVNLTVTGTNTLNSSVTICSGHSYSLPWGGVATTSGVYSDTIRYASGCDSLIRSVTVQVNAAATNTSSAVICSGQSFTLPWGGTANATGTYRDTIRRANGCDSLIRMVQLTVNAPVTVNSSASICSGQTHILPWGATANQSGIYRDTLHYGSGCDSLIRVVQLHVTATAVNNIKDISICEGEQYHLPWGGVASVAGTYSDTVRTAAGCDSLVTKLVLTVNPLPVTTVTKSNDVNCALGIAKLTATGGNQYVWTPAGTLNNASVNNPVASPTASTLYHVQVTSAAGCVSEDSIMVLVKPDPSGNMYLLPGAFTPDGDGLNDCFGVKSWGGITELKFSVYNRWGQLIFYTTDPTKCWDGSFKGKMLTSDVFVYQVSATTACGKIYRKGTIAIIK
jgi:gliding motility-associated-like protein